MGTIAYEGNDFSLRINDQGKEFIYTGNEVLTVPITEQREVILIQESSAAFGIPVLVLSGGKSSADENHSETAIRELREEIGYAARRLDYLGELHPYSKYLTVRSFVYLAQDLVPSKLEDEYNEVEQIQRVPLAQFEQLIADGYLQDARVIAALYMARNFLKQQADFNI